jgi:gamma-glutamyltranspeptidase/glutathione hydrolase
VKYLIFNAQLYLIAAALSMTEPASAGIGGDTFCLFFDSKTKKVHSLNGSGRSPKNATLEQIQTELDLKSADTGKLPFLGTLSVTVPGAATG